MSLIVRPSMSLDRLQDVVFAEKSINERAKQQEQVAFCAFCGTLFNRGNFSEAQLKAGWQVRYCLRHSSSVGRAAAKLQNKVDLEGVNKVMVFRNWRCDGYTEMIARAPVLRREVCELARMQTVCSQWCCSNGRAVRASLI